MTDFPMPYGDTSLTFRFVSGEVPELITPKTTPPAHNPLEVVRDALRNPVGAVDWSGINSTTKVAIAVNDKTRPVPHQHLLLPLLDMLESQGAARSNIQLIIASGTHTPMQEAEVTRLLPPEVYSRYPICVHDCDDRANLCYLGKTTRRTPVWLNQLFASADYKIVTGNIEPHHFMGFSGGVKSASIGLMGRETININHSFLLDVRSALGVYEENPMRQDVEEMGRMIGVDFALNTILDEGKQIIHAISGDPLTIMGPGIELSRQVCRVRVNKLYDLVIASVGGTPKDINLYQSQKALSRASRITRDGGVVILVAECPEGIGSAGFETFMQGVPSPQAVFEKFKLTGFEVGPHKALQFARDLQRIRVVLLSSLKPNLVEKLLLIPASTPAEALKLARQLLPERPQIALLPYAKNILPELHQPGL